APAGERRSGGGRRHPGPMPGPGKHERPRARHCVQHTRVSAYDAIAHIYDPWSRTVVEDVPFYVAEARQAGGPVVELAIGTGRIAVPIAVEGLPVIGADASEGMLEVARGRAALPGGELDLR